MAEKKKSTWEEFLKMLLRGLEANNDLRFRERYSQPVPAQQGRTITPPPSPAAQTAPAAPEVAAPSVVRFPNMFAKELVGREGVREATQAMPGSVLPTTTEAAVSEEEAAAQALIEEMWANRLDRFAATRGRSKTGTTAGVNMPGAASSQTGYNVGNMPRRAGMENTTPRGTEGSDLWWYDMTQIYDQWTPELQQQWRDTFGRPIRDVAPYQVFPYWKYNKPTRIGTAYNKNRYLPINPNKPMDDNKLSQQEAEQLGIGNTGNNNTTLGKNLTGNQMVSWRR